MKVKILRSSSAQAPFHFAATYVINETLAIDAGSLGFTALEEQHRIRHVVLSHTHLDHIASLPIFLDNVHAAGCPRPTVYASLSVTECLQSHLFNDQLWPDVFRMAASAPPVVEFEELAEGRPAKIGRLRITPVELNHVIPCFGFLIEEGNSAIALVSDTGPTERIWNLGRQTQNLKAVFLESAFPNSMTWLAERAKHLTPAMLLGEYRKLDRPVPVVVIHIKPVFHDQVVKELGQLGLPALTIGEPDREYEF